MSEDDLLNLQHQVDRHEGEFDQQAKEIQSLRKDVDALIMLFKHLTDVSSNRRDLIFSTIRLEENVQAKDRFFALLDEVLVRRSN
jgi:hypothetical protein